MVRMLKWLAVALLVAAEATVFSAAESRQGVQSYEVIPGVSQPARSWPVKVQEFFWYGCPHCFRLDPLITSWAAHLPKGIVFERVPDSLGRAVGVVDERAYYIASMLGILGETHQALFDAIHVKGEPMGTLRQIRSLYVSVAGISPQQFDRVAGSAQVAHDVRRAEELAQHDRITSVPTLVVGGYYKTNGALASAGHPDEGEMASYRSMLCTAKKLALRLRAAKGG